MAQSHLYRDVQRNVRRFKKRALEMSQVNNGHAELIMSCRRTVYGAILETRLLAFITL